MKSEIKLFFVVGFIFLFACRKDVDVANINNLNGNKIIDLGHGGMGNTFKFPMDSYESISACLSSGAAGTELDLQVTKDSVLVVFHHNQLDNFASCYGKINDQNWSDIDGCKFSSPTSSQIYIMSLDGILNRTDNQEKYYYSLDCKLDSGYQTSEEYKQKFANAIVDISSKYNIMDRIFVESNDVQFLQKIKNKANKIQCFYGVIKPIEQAIVAKQTGLNGIIAHQKNISRVQVDSIHKMDLKVMLWGCYLDSENISTIAKSPDIIQSDKITHLTKYLKGIN